MDFSNIDEVAEDLDRPAKVSQPIKISLKPRAQSIVPKEPAKPKEKTDEELFQEMFPNFDGDKFVRFTEVFTPRMPPVKKPVKRKDKKSEFNAFVNYLTR